MKKLFKPSIFFFLLLTGTLISQNARAQFTLSAELRPRTEYSHGQGMPAVEDQNPSLFTSQRTRLNFGYSNDDNIKLGIVLQDIRLWGSQPQLVENQERATSVHEAWGEFSFAENFSLKAGRQELVYDDSRILGNVGWAQQARSHDVALLKYAGDFKLHLGLAHHENDNRTNNYYGGPDAYKNLQFVWFHNNPGDINYSILLLNNGVPGPVPQDGSDQEVFYSRTLGGRVETALDELTLAGNIYFQTGKDAADNDLRAFELALEAHKNLGHNTRAALRYEVLSGNDPGSDENNAFTPLYGTNHKFNGFMDYFYVGGRHLNSVGLHDLQLTGSAPVGNTSLRGDVHYFASHQEFDDGHFLGIEIDLGLSMPLGEAASFSAGYSQMFAADRLATLNNINNKGSLHNWAYVMLSFNPGLL